VATVLVVDDDPGFLALAARVLEGMGATVVATVEDPASARAAAEDNRPEAMLVDVGLENGGGIELAHELASLPWGPRVVLISSDSDAGRAVAAFDGTRHVPFVPKEELASDTLRELLLGT
jgi:CheY-like chemotaxis protein